MKVLLVLGSVGAASVPLLLFLLLIRWLDRYEREPLGVVLLVFFAGGIGSVGVSQMAYTAPLVFTQGAGPEMQGAIIAVLAPFIEEPIKMLALLVILRSRHFDNPTDGFVYGFAIGLGFGMMENFFYFSRQALTGTTADWVSMVVIRTLLTAPMHSCATGIVGIALGYAKLRSWRKRLVWVPVGLVCAFVVHGTWNTLQVVDPLSLGGPFPVRESIIIAAEVGLLVLVYQGLLVAESRMIRRELAAEAELGTLPADHVGRLGSWTSRVRYREWLPPSIDPGAYFEAATMLAMRRYQHGLRPDDRFYEAEVPRLREVLKGLSGGSARAHSPAG